MNAKYLIFLTIFCLIFASCSNKISDEDKAKDMAIKEIIKTNESINNVQILNYEKQNCNGCHNVYLSYQIDNQTKEYLVQIRSWVVYHINEEIQLPKIN